MGIRRQNGYTIIEVLIFLMITGFMFATAVIAVGGTQDEARYSQAVRDFEIQIKDVINDVQNGYYPTLSRGRCSVNGMGEVGFNNSFNINPAQNVECINVGKNLMFNLPEEDQFGVGVIVGNNPGIEDSLDLSPAGLKPTLAYKPTGSNPLDLTVYKPVRYGATVTKIGSNNNPGQEYSSLMFLSNFSNTGVDADSRTNGTLSIDVYGVRGSLTSSTDLSDYTAEVVGLTNASTYDVNPADGFYVCLLTTDDRRARIIIGVDGVVTATNTQFDLDSGPICP